MKNIYLFFITSILLVACNPIPNKSVFDELSREELASAIKADPKFAEFYEKIRLSISLVDFSAIQKAQFKDVTYRRLYKYINHSNDKEYWEPLETQWKHEWNKSMKKDLSNVDKKVAEWTEYKKKNSLDKFAKIELSKFFITHYEYIGGVRDAFIYFNITPLLGTIEQLKFTYSYNYKINKEKGKKSHNCFCSSPISKKKESVWEIDYWEREKFDGMTVKKFLEEYDLNIEITDVRKDGKNYSLADLNIPQEIYDFWNEDSSDTRDAVARLINPSYVNLKEYIENNKQQKLKKYDSLCFDFLECLESNAKSRVNVLNEFLKIFN